MSTALPEPFTTLLDLDAGLLDPQRHVTERTLADMAGMYLEDAAGDRVDAAGDRQDAAGDRVVYRVYAIPVPESNSEIQCSTTVLEPGTVGREYHMTKGHFHEVRDRAEVYVGLAGEGRLVMATEDGDVAVEPIRRGTVSYVPGGWAHRSVNVGDAPLVFFAAYVGDAGHDYGTIEARGFPVLVVRGADGPEMVPNPRYGG